MKLVIDIPDDIYNDIDSYAKFPTHATPILRNVIKAGIALPEERGDLIDRDELKSKMPTPIEDEYKTAYSIIDSMPAVIEADI